MNEEAVDDLDIRRKRQCIRCGIWYPVEYVEAQPEEGWDIDLNRPFYACKRCLGRLVGLGDFLVKDEDQVPRVLRETNTSDTYLGEPE